MIFVIMGNSLSGKTTVAKGVSNNTGTPIIITSTDRPIRDGEVDGVDYNFFDIGEINRNTHFGIREFFTAYRKEPFTYGMSYSDFEKTNPTGTHSLIVLDPLGYKELKDEVGAENLVSVYLNTPMEEMYARANNRGDSIEEVKRRIVTDEHLFSNADIYCDLVFEDGDVAIETLTSIIQGEVNY